MDAALALVREENARGSSYYVNESLCRAIIGRALETGDDTVLIDLLRSNQNNHLILFDDPFIDSPFWVALTEATGDPDHSVELLQFLDKPHGYGQAMAQIISSQDEIPLREQIDWLGTKIDDQGELDRAVTGVIIGKFPAAIDPFSGEYVGLSLEMEQWLDLQENGSSSRQFLRSLVASLSRAGGHVIAWEFASRIDDPNLNRYGRLLYDANKGLATRILPPELIEQLSDPGP